ncbi:MAG: 1-deoxy-D-xylulose-5-phosphate reductoisomerase [Clostridia bacterium]|nr:1-deoxy-D-xylulose-5-phosphate reductoisomerase [Clostridia bacterium]
MPEYIAVLGSTGSVGTQALDVARKSKIKVDLITADKNVKLVEEQAREFGVRYCAMADESAASALKTALADTSVRVFSGREGICEAISLSSAETVVNSILGEAGLMPTLATLDAKKRLALANKESLVIAGDIVTDLAKKNGAEIIPVDSEHSAIFQCLQTSRGKEVKKILLTASGGPFFGMSREELKGVTLEKTLAHPTWKMGAKITVDSASMMNKGFEVIEACRLFDVSPSKVEVVVHRESIMHSAVEYIDNAVIAQLSVPDMRLCVQYALTYPARTEACIDELDLFKICKLTFARPDMEAFPLLSLAYRSMELGGAMPAVLNAANEVAVAAFLKEKIRFFEISQIVGDTFEKMTKAKAETALDAIIESDREARRIALSMIN